MNIIKPGDELLIKKPVQFTCRNCGCIFEATANEYTMGTIYHTCICPCCGKQVITKKE